MAQDRNLESSYNIETASEALSKMDNRYTKGAWRLELTYTMKDNNVDLPMAVMIAIVDNADSL